MAVTVARVAGPYSTGDRFKSVSTVTMDSSYVTNGEPLTRAQLGFASTVDPEFNVTVQPTAGYIGEYDHVNQKLKAYDQKDPAAAGGADIALPEVGNTVNLAAVVFRVVAEGKYRL